MYLQDLKFSCK